MRRFMLTALVAVFCCSLAVSAQTTTTYVGTVKDLTGAPVTSGRITWTLNAPSGGVISGIGSFTATTVSCLINATGNPVASSDGISPCTIVNNTALTPNGTSYTMCRQPYFVTPGACSTTYAIGGIIDISMIVPTPATQPYYGVPGGAQGPQGIQGLQGVQGIQGQAALIGTERGSYSPSTPYAVGDVVAYGGQSYASLVANNTGNEPDTSIGQWGLLANISNLPQAFASQSQANPQPIYGSIVAVGSGNTMLNATKSRNLLPNDVDAATTFNDDVANPMGGCVSVEASIVVESGTAYEWGTCGDGNTWLQTANNALLNNWSVVGSSPVLTGYRYSNVFSYGGTYYMTAAPNTNSPTAPGNIYLFTSTNKTTWTIANSGNPVCTHSASASAWNYNLFNSAAQVVGSTVYFLVEGVTQGNSTSLGISTVPLASLTTANFNTNLVKLVDNVESRDTGGNPWINYVPDRNAVLVGYFDRSNHGLAPGGAGGMQLLYGSLSNNLLTPSNWTPAPNFSFWKWEPGFGNGNYSAMASDGFLVDLTGLGKTHNLLFAYNWAQQAGEQAYSDLTLDQFYDAVTNAGTVFNLSKGTIRLTTPEFYLYGPDHINPVIQYLNGVLTFDSYTPIYSTYNNIHFTGSSVDISSGSLNLSGTTVGFGSGTTLFQGSGNVRPQLNNTTSGSTSEWTYTNSSDAADSWASGRNPAFGFAIEHSTGYPFGTGTTIQPLTISTAGLVTLGYGVAVTGAETVTGTFGVSTSTSSLDRTQFNNTASGTPQTDIAVGNVTAATSAYFGVNWQGSSANAYLDNRSGGSWLFKISGTTDMSISTGGVVQVPGLHSTTGTRYVCADTSGNLASSTTACSGT